MTRVRVLQRHKLQFGHTPCRTAPYIAVQAYTLSYSSLHHSSDIHPVVQLLASQFRHTPCRTAPCIAVQTSYTLSYGSLHRSSYSSLRHSSDTHLVVQLLASQFVQLLALHAVGTHARGYPQQPALGVADAVIGAGLSHQLVISRTESRSRRCRLSDFLFFHTCRKAC